MSAPKVSVVIPCYDLGRYVDEAVESVLAQTVLDVEIVIVNDGSSDPATNALLAGYQRPKTRVLTTEHRGLAAARNLGVRETRGEYLCALDADDRLAPSYLEKAVALLDADPSLAFVSSWLETFGDESWIWKQEACDVPALLVEDTVHTAAVVRRAVLTEVDGYDGAMGAQGYEDWDLWLSLVERGHRGTIIPEVLFHYRRRAGSMSATCCVGEAHLGLVRYLVDKHAPSYRRHLIDVLLRKDAVVGELLRVNDTLERHLTTQLEPEVARRRDERNRLRRRVAAIEAEDARATERQRLAERVALLEAGLERTEAEVTALRASWSWRLTAPLRAGYDWLARRSPRS